MTTPEQPTARPSSKATYLAGLPVIFVIIIAAGWFATRGNLGGAQPPRNVLLITVDTTRADVLGCLAPDIDTTPNIDRLANEGVLFTQCRSCSPTTLPSHSSMMTSLYPYAHGARENAQQLFSGNTTLAEVLRDAGFQTRGTIAGFVLNAQFGIDQGFDVYHGVPAPTTGQILTAERKGDDISDDALQMLDEIHTDPFFMWVHFYDPHFPYEHPEIESNLSPIAYAYEVNFMDQQIGRLLDRLETLDQLDNTLIVLVADHGEGLGQHDELAHGYFLYETTQHVALMFRYPPQLPAGTEIDAQVRTIDIAPTILEMLDLPNLPGAQGLSLMPLIDGEASDLNLPAYAETLTPFHDYNLSPLRSWTADGWKYIHAPKPELYDLRTDPGETINQADAQPERVNEMREQLRSLIVDAPLPPAPDEVGTNLSDAELEMLRGLGYVGGGTEGTIDESKPEIERFEPVGGNPRDYADYFTLTTVDLAEMLRAKRYAEAEAKLREVLEALPDAWRRRIDLVNVLIKQQKGEQALDVLRVGLERDPDNPSLRREYGMLLTRRRQFEAALEQFQQIIAKHPDDALSLSQMSITLTYLGRHEEAAATAKQSAELDPGSVRPWRAIALANEDVGRLVEALQYFNQALEVDPDCTQCEEDRQRVNEKIGW